MTLEELIYKQLSEYEPLKSLLTQYADKPAIFYPEAPADTATGWGSSQYPRISYHLDMRTNQERKSVGTLVMLLFCLNDTSWPEQIEPVLRQCLKDVLLKPEGRSPFCFTWASTNAFDIYDKGVTGSEIIFDILEYPCQITTDPDPVDAANQYIKKLFPETCVLWHDKVEDITVTKSSSPVFYCRIESIEKSRETNTVAWMSGRIAVHLLCPDASMRIKILTALANRLSLEGEVIMMDRSPMFIKRLQINHRADYLSEGQLYIMVEYGLLRYPEKKHALIETKTNYRKGAE